MSKKGPPDQIKIGRKKYDLAYKNLTKSHAVAWAKKERAMGNSARVKKYGIKYCVYLN